MRLPEFLTKLSPIRETLDALSGAEAELSAAAEQANRQLHVSTADTALPLWEADLSLSVHTGEPDEARRAHIRAAMVGGKTMTPRQLAALAVAVGGADGGTVEEAFGQYQATLYAEGENRLPPDTAALSTAVEKLRPAHLDITVIPRGNFRGCSPLYAALYGSCVVELYGSAETPEA